MSGSSRAFPSNAPSGTITFVFTDIEGSTRRWDSDRRAMEAAVRTHDALVRTAIAGNGGHVFKTIGDAFCAAFSKPEDAVAAMFQAQRALAVQDFSSVDGLRVRVAIHTGTADERDDDYFGPTVNRVARLLSVTHGGQVLLSGVTGDLVRGALPDGATLHGLGRHRLKDLSHPENVYQLAGPGLTAEFPPLPTLGNYRNNLPVQTTSFVGREAEVGEIEALIRRHRLVTLVGAGGIGKTRTSIHAAADLIADYPDGVWFVELAPLSSGDFLASTIAQTLGTSLPDGDPTMNLVKRLEQKRSLLVFDNCEHIVDSVARIVGAILRGCPEIRVIASSRQALGIGGESVFRMPSLSSRSAVALFADRARACDGRFTLTDENEPIVYRHLPPARRDRAGYRARRRAGEDPHATSDPRPAGRALPRAHRRQPRCFAASANAPRAHRLELRSPRRPRTHAPATRRGLRGRLPSPRRGRGRRRSGPR
jgi:class 3 adenylate cyclase